MTAVFKSLLFLLLALLLFVAGVLVPGQLRSVHEAVLRAAGAGGEPLGYTIANELDAARTATAGLLLAGAAEGPSGAGLRARRDMLFAGNPEYGLTGGPAPYLQSYLELIGFEPEGGERPVLELLMTQADRDSLARLLERSSNAVVQSLLAARNLRGLAVLRPADHPAGAPYDSAVLSAALLVQGGHFPAERAGRLKTLSESARNGDLPSIRAFEEFAFATVALGRRLPYVALAELAAAGEGLDAWTAAAELLRAYPDDTAGLYAALFLSGDPAGVAGYLRMYPERGYEDLRFVLPLGAGAVSELLGRSLPRYRPPPLAASLEERLGAFRPAAVNRLAVDLPTGMRAFKFLLFLLAGWSVAFALGAAWRGEKGAGPRLSRANPFVIARDALTSVVGALLAWMLVEPDLLRGAADRQLPGVRLEFAVADTLESLKSPMTAMQDLNQVTLLVLALFFVVQLIIYALCLIKLREIRKQASPASLKLSLLENEENLFDFGLYVGLGGTVASLILVAIGIVEASLMAAYASTLFGILFVAMIKIFHVRPVRRELILEAARDLA